MADGSEELDGSVGDGFEEYLFYLVTQVQNRRTRDFASALEALGISIAHWRALSTVNRLDGCLMSELAEFTTVDRTTLTRTIDQLVEIGLVERRTSSEDRRLVRVELTAEGGDVFARAVEALKVHNQRALDGVQPEDLRALRAVLQKMLRNIVSDDELFPQVLNFSR